MFVVKKRPPKWLWFLAVYCLVLFFFHPNGMAVEPTPKHYSPYVEVLSEHFQQFSPTGNSTSCHHLSYVLETLYQSPDRHPGLQLFSLIQQEPSHPIVTSIQTALHHCLKTYPSLKHDKHLVRHDVLLSSLDGNPNLFTERFMAAFFPFSPKQIPAIYQIYEDIKLIYNTSQENPPPSFHSATALLNAVLYPNTFLQRIEVQFSPYFFQYFQSKVWEVHFEYQKAFVPLTVLLDQYYLNDPPLPIEPLLRPFELSYIKSKKKSLLKSPKRLLKHLKWLARRIGQEESYDTLYRYHDLIESKTAAVPKFKRSNLTFEDWKRSHEKIRSLWNNDQNELAILNAKALLADISFAPLKLKKQLRTKRLQGELMLLLARIYDAENKHAQSLVWFDHAKTLCSDRHARCYLPYYRNRIYIHLTHQEYAAALPLLNNMINSNKLEAIEKQEFHFWKAVVSKKLNKPYHYEFPFITIYRQYASCLNGTTLDDAMMPKTTKPTLFTTPQNFDPIWLKRILPTSKIELLRTALNNKDADASSTITQLLSTAALRIAKQYNGRSKKPALKSEQLISFLQLLNRYNMYSYSISILYKIISKTPINQLSKEFIRLYFPLAFEKDIEAAASKYNVPKPLISAFIRRESIFNKEAVSPMHALGLMQILPDTAKRLAKKFKVPYRHYSKQTATLFVPENNILFGSLYLKQLFNQFDHEMIYVIASYNAGEHRVEKWQNRLSKVTNFPLLYIERIPYQETRLYVKWIMLHNLYYTFLYDQPNKQAVENQFCQFVTKMPILDTTKPQKPILEAKK